LLVIVFFLSTLCFSCFEVTLALLVCDNFGLNIKDIRHHRDVATYLFVYWGLIAALCKGDDRSHVKKFGEPKSSPSASG